MLVFYLPPQTDQFVITSQTCRRNSRHKNLVREGKGTSLSRSSWQLRQKTTTKKFTSDLFQPINTKEQYKFLSIHKIFPIHIPYFFYPENTVHECAVLYILSKRPTYINLIYVYSLFCAYNDTALYMVTNAFPRSLEDIYYT